MTYDELITEVHLLTKRPDLIAETKSAIKMATLKAHQTDFYSKDIHETNITTPTLAYVQSIDYISLISNFRAFKYLRKYDADDGEAGDFFDIVTPEELFDSYGKARTNVAYVAGRAINVKSSTKINNLILGCYVFPIITDSGYSSWVAELYPFAIIQEAVRVILKIIGSDEQAASLTTLVAEQYALLKISAVSDVGY